MSDDSTLHPRLELALLSTTNAAMEVELAKAAGDRKRLAKAQADFKSSHAAVLRLLGKLENLTLAP